MKMNQVLLDALNREVERSRRVLEQTPAGKYDWKPHDKSMILGYLSDMVATIPSWITAIVTQDSLDIAPQESTVKPEPKTTSGELVAALEESAVAARRALSDTNDEFLRTSWQLKAAGTVVLEGPRDETILDTLSHWAHHRGQMTVYLRLLGATVPSTYGPSADDNSFR
jgi:uncharacterized damage-inducible protein DinB